MDDQRKLEGTLVFSVVGRPNYGFDIFVINLPANLSVHSRPNYLNDHLVTDAKSINYNGQFVSPSDTKLLLLRENADTDRIANEEEEMVVYVSERTGNARIHFGSSCAKALGPLLCTVSPSNNVGFFFDRPVVKNGKAYFVSMQEPADKPLKSWSAVYSTCLRTGHTVRLTPRGTVDYSPSISPSGKWAMVASYGERDWELSRSLELSTDLYVFKAEDGSARKIVAQGGGWPTWADENTVYFHKKAEDGWWSIYRLKLPSDPETIQEPIKPERITPPSIHAFTPCASATGDWIVVATRRPGTKFRHIEIFDLGSESFLAVTSLINPEIHHYNPFVSSDSRRLGFHRFRGEVGTDTLIPFLDPIESPLPKLELYRLNGSFPAFSPDGSLIAFNPNLTEEGGVLVLKADGSKRWRIFKGPAFAVAWNGKQKGLVHASVGPIFAPDQATVHIISISFKPEDLALEESEEVKSEVRILTKDGTKNNAFPSSSPDGKQLVFRSGRSGHKNLYIMDAEKGEEGGIYALTEGPWIDTMPSWSPDGEWIAFSSNRDDPEQGGYFSIYLVHPDGTGLHKVPGISKERINHVCFSPDSKSLLFTANLSGVSAEPISLPNQFQPYGELFISRLDGSEVQRLTFNAYEDGTPAWAQGCSALSLQSLNLDGKKIAGEKLKGEFEEPYWLVTPP